MRALSLVIRECKSKSWSRSRWALDHYTKMVGSRSRLWRGSYFFEARAMLYKYSLYHTF